MHAWLGTDVAARSRPPRSGVSSASDCACGCVTDELSPVALTLLLIAAPRPRLLYMHCTRKQPKQAHILVALSLPSRNDSSFAPTQSTMLRQCAYCPAWVGYRSIKAHEVECKQVMEELQYVGVGAHQDADAMEEEVFEEQQAPRPVRRVLRRNNLPLKELRRKQYEHLEREPAADPRIAFGVHRPDAPQYARPAVHAVRHRGRCAMARRAA